MATPSITWQSTTNYHQRFKSNTQLLLTYIMKYEDEFVQVSSCMWKHFFPRTGQVAWSRIPSEATRNNVHCTTEVNLAPNKCSLHSTRMHFNLLSWHECLKQKKKKFVQIYFYGGVGTTSNQIQKYKRYIDPVMGNACLPPTLRGVWRCTRKARKN